MRRWAYLTPESAFALVALGAVGVTVYLGGARMFSPGALSAQSRTETTLGGVASHAEIENNCGACHAPPWSGTSMANLCQDCHVGVRDQIDSRGPLHGRLPEGAGCRECHSEHNGPEGVLTRLDGFDHDLAAFRLTGKHTSVDCATCHTNHVYRGTPQTCVACHPDPEVHKGRLGTECAACHSTSTWKGTVFQPGAFNHDVAAFRLTGKHTAAACAACHVNNVFHGTPQTCVACHPDPEVHKGRLGTECAQCHSTATWKSVVFQPGAFNHDAAAFKLTGKHTAVDCAACHAKEVYRGTPQTCVACHSDPEIHRGRLGTECAQCHTTDTWKSLVFQPGAFSHDVTAFKLTGKHAGVDCAACHANNMFRGTPQTCVACHPEPEVHKGRLGTECAQCHSTETWEGVVLQPGKFNHDAATFKLTGKHTSVDCAACHVKNVYHGTPQTCVACHADPPVHKGLLGTDCARCHTTSTWRNATFEHTFPLNHGHRGRTPTPCATCHPAPENPKTYTCYGCHEHSQSRIERKHSEKRIPDLEDCVRCHKTGHGHEGRGEGRGREGRGRRD